MSRGPGADLLGSITDEARELTERGVLPVTYLDELEVRWQAIAADRAALEAAVALPDRPGDRQVTEEGPASLRGAAHRVARRVGSRAKRAVGPRARALERASAKLAVQLAEELSTRSQVDIDRARRLGESSSLLRRLSRVSPVARSYPSAQPGSSAPIDDVLEELVVDRLLRNGVSHVGHAECGDGSLLRQLSERGISGEGADPARGQEVTLARGRGEGPARRLRPVLQPVPQPSVVEAGALEYLGRKRRASLEALVLSGLTDGLRPSSARALVHLAQRKMRPGGTLVIVSARPGSLAELDPIVSDLSARRPLRPVTWCHLLSRYGFGEITVNDEADRSHFVIFATR